ncbi:MAG: 3-deoxy-7-phosphoheptulonate synthase, partial [Plesiomonas sp.]
MPIRTDELRTARIDTLVTPDELAAEYPLDDQIANTVMSARK